MLVHTHTHNYYTKKKRDRWADGWMDEWTTIEANNHWLSKQGQDFFSAQRREG